MGLNVSCAAFIFTFGTATLAVLVSQYFEWEQYVCRSHDVEPADKEVSGFAPLVASVMCACSVRSDF